MNLKTRQKVGGVFLINIESKKEENEKIKSIYASF